MQNWSLGESVGAGIAGVLALVFTLQKLMTFWKRERVDQNGADAIATQFSALQTAIKQHADELAQLRARVGAMDQTIHKQQKTITRLEMLVIHLKGLLAGSGIPIPPSIQREIVDLVEARE